MMMTLKHLKFTTLCLAMIGGSQTVMAETQTQLLPLFKAAEIPALCDANLDKMKKDIQKLKIRLKPVLIWQLGIHCRHRSVILFHLSVYIVMSILIRPCVRRQMTVN